MFDHIFDVLINQLLTVLSAVSGVVVIAISITISLIAYKKYRQAMFLSSPASNDEFVAFYKDNRQDFDDYKSAAQRFLELKNLSAQYEILYAKEIKQERKLQLKQERKDAYHYMQSLGKKTFDVELDKQDYEFVGFDDN